MTYPNAQKEMKKALDVDRGGCVAALLFFLILIGCLVGAFAGGSTAPFVGASEDQTTNALLGNLPGLGVKTPAPTIATTAAPTATTEPPVAETSPPQQGQSQAPQQAPQQPQTPQTQPPVIQPPSCAFGGPISVQGGNVGSLASSGGSFTVTSLPVSVSVGGLQICGQHYRLQYSGTHSGGGGFTGSDCKLDGFSVGMSFAQVGDTVNVQLLLPPNACG
jgi:hypothetical protein